jgi:hypothetical protein
MTSVAGELSARLARDAERVCRQYLSNGRREGGYWRVGDVANTRGTSLYVRLRGPDTGPGAAGRWSDAATGEHGDLLDLIRLACGLTGTRAAIAEAQAFLGGSQAPAAPKLPSRPPSNSVEAARRLWAVTRPLRGTLAERYLRGRGLDPPLTGALRFHPACVHRERPDAAAEPRPALIAAVTDTAGELGGVHRTWLMADGSDKAEVAEPRRALGRILGHAVWFGTPTAVLAAGEGIETILSIKRVLPPLPVAAALSAGHLGALVLPRGLQRLYLAEDADEAGRRAVARLTRQAEATGVVVQVLAPRLDDFNTDLQRFGPEALRARLLGLLAPEDAETFG